MKAWIIITKDGAQCCGITLDEAERRAASGVYRVEFDTGYQLEIRFDIPALEVLPADRL